MVITVHVVKGSQHSAHVDAPITDLRLTLNREGDNS